MGQSSALLSVRLAQLLLLQHPHASLPTLGRHHAKAQAGAMTTRIWLLDMRHAHIHRNQQAIVVSCRRKLAGSIGGRRG
jgi:hypothetical protein